MRFLKQCLQALTSSPLSLPDPARRPPLFQSSTLTESLEQAIFLALPTLFLASPVLGTSEPARRLGKLAFSNPSGLKNLFKKLRCRDGFGWTVSLTVEMEPTNGFPVRAEKKSSCEASPMTSAKKEIFFSLTWSLLAGYENKALLLNLSGMVHM